MNRIIDRETAVRQGETEKTIHDLSLWHIEAARKSKNDADPASAHRHYDIANRLDKLAMEL